MPRIVSAAREAGAAWIGHAMLRLPGSVATVFAERLRRALPLRAEKVLSRTREMRGGKLYDPRFGARMSGSGEYADAVEGLFLAAVARAGFPPRARENDASVPTTFRRPTDRGGQLRLFG